MPDLTLKQQMLKRAYLIFKIPDIIIDTINLTANCVEQKNLLPLIFSFASYLFYNS